LPLQHCWLATNGTQESGCYEYKHLSALCLYQYVDQKQKQGDLTLKMPKAIYILELKYGKSADEALSQIDECGYARKYALDGRPVVKVGHAFSQEERE